MRRVARTILSIAALLSTPVLARGTSVTPPPNDYICDDGQEGLQLDFPPNRQEFRKLPDGSLFYGFSGTIRNVSAVRCKVAPIRVVFRDANEQIVLETDVVAPKRELAPGEELEVNQVIADIPRNAKYRDIGWKPRN